MAIEINKNGKDTVEAPQVNLTGNVINTSNGQVALSRAIRAIGSQDIEQSGLEVNNRDEIVFFDSVAVTLIPDVHWLAHNYKNLKKPEENPGETKRIEGSEETRTSNSHNDRSDTYYTLNGKSPKRTKSNLYTGPFTINRNTSGDNIILKVRTYVAGQESKVRTVQLRLIKKNPLIVNG